MENISNAQNSRGHKFQLCIFSSEGTWGSDSRIFAAFNFAAHSVAVGLVWFKARGMLENEKHLTSFTSIHPD